MFFRRVFSLGKLVFYLLLSHYGVFISTNEAKREVMFSYCLSVCQLMSKD